MKAQDYTSIELRFQNGTSNKFYRILRKNSKTFNVESGRIGSLPRVYVFDADKAQDKLDEKIKEGYKVHTVVKVIAKKSKEKAKDIPKIKPQPQSSIWDEF